MLGFFVAFIALFYSLESIFSFSHFYLKEHKGSFFKLLTSITKAETSIKFEDAKRQLLVWKNISQLSDSFTSSDNNDIDMFIVKDSEINNTIGFVKTSEYLVTKEMFATLNRAYIACKQGFVFVNNTKVYSTHKLRSGDILTVTRNRSDDIVMNDRQLKDKEVYLYRLLNFTNSLISTKDGAPQIRIIYEDDHIAVVYKPSGIHSLRWIGTMKKRFFALDDVLPLLLTPPVRLLINNNKRYRILDRPLPCHRLDARVSGCIVVAKTQQSLVNINSQFANRLVHKEYIAIVAGKIDKSLFKNSSSSELEVTYPVGGRPAQTILRVINETDCNVYGALTRVSLSPLTGRRHQLRQHCVALGCPILGDDLYHSAASFATVQERLASINQISRVNNIEKDFDDSDLATGGSDDVMMSLEVDRINDDISNNSNSNSNTSKNVRKGVGLLLTSVGVEFEYPDIWNSSELILNKNKNYNSSIIEHIRYNNNTNIFSVKLSEPYKFTKIFNKASKGANWLKSKIITTV